MNSGFPFELTRSLLLDYLASNPQGSFGQAPDGVARLAAERGLFTPPRAPFDNQFSSTLPHHEQEAFRELVRQLFWQFLVEGILVFGINELNPDWPRYRLTQYGLDVVKGHGPQPYDPDGFLREFRAKVPNADPVIVLYLEEAVRAFNHNCPIASAVMVGGVSEKAILLLHEAFEAAIENPAHKAKFETSYRWTIHSKYQALRDGLEKMVQAKTLPRDLSEVFASELPGAFELIRRQRNSAGHPEIYSGISRDTVFLNLRIISEYVFQIYRLITYFESQPAKW